MSKKQSKYKWSVLNTLKNVITIKPVPFRNRFTLDITYNPTKTIYLKRIWNARLV